MARKRKPDDPLIALLATAPPRVLADLDFRWHDLRHTWASWHVQNGTSLQELMELGGWASFEMVLHIETAILGTGMALVDPATTARQRGVMIDKLRRLEQERSTTNAEVPGLEQDLARRADKLNILSADQRY